MIAYGTEKGLAELLARLDKPCPVVGCGGLFEPGDLPRGGCSLEEAERRTRRCKRSRTCYLAAMLREDPDGADRLIDDLLEAKKRRGPYGKPPPLP